MIKRKEMRATPVNASDCVDKIPSQFDLVIIASRRVRELHKGATPLVPENGDHKMTIALREIAAGLVGKEYLYKEVHQAGKK